MAQWYARRLPRLVLTSAMMVLLVGAMAVCPCGVALADEGEEAVALAKPDSEGVIVGEDDEGDGLFDAYVEQRIEETLPGSDVELEAQSASAQLSGNDLRAYNALVPLIKKVAAGELSGTVFCVPATTVYGTDGWTAADLGLTSLEDKDEVFKIINAKTNVYLSPVIQALIADLPYELYWYNKTHTSVVTYQGRGDVSGVTYSFNADKTKVTLSGNVCFLFPVSDGYAPANATYETRDNGEKVTYDFDTAHITRVNTALANAAKIVQDNANKTYREKLDAYRQKICDLVTYDSDAMSSTHSQYYYGDPWQMINVFDGDTSTNVVCEGYAKAFKYLCDLTDFGGKIECLLVDGKMTGDTGAGDHTWNILRMDDARNYLVDVTNCDTGTIGNPDLLFLAAASSGTVNSSYTFSCGSQSISYEYGSGTRSVMTTSDLLISQDAYGTHRIAIDDQTYIGSPIKLAFNLKAGNTQLVEGTDFTASYANNTNVGMATVTITPTSTGAIKGTDPFVETFNIVPANISGVTIDAVADQTYEGSAIVPALSAKFNNTTLTLGTDYTVSCQNNVDAGTAKVTVTGTGNFTGTREVSFSIVRKPIVVRADDATKVYGAADPTFTSTAEGAYERDDVYCMLSRVLGENVGEYEITAEGNAEQGNYTVTYASGKLTITPASLSGATVTPSQATYTYSGSACTPGVTVVLGDKTLTADTDYTVSYKNNVNAGTATVTVTGKGNYAGSKDATFTIEAASSEESEESESDVERVTMYRVYNPNSGEHFYTANVAERDSIVSVGWVDEGVGWIAPSTSDTPVYRLYSGTDHHYTTNAEERDKLISVGWVDEGIGWYSDDAQGTPLYRQFNPNVDPHAARNNSGSHNYTTSKEENDFLVSVGWIAEGIGWYGMR